MSNKVTNLTGAMDTVRDYVSTQDISNYVCSVIENPANSNTINFLVSGKPTSIGEIKSLIEKMLKKSILLSYSLNPNNKSTISFSHNVKAKGFLTENLIEGISRIYNSFK